MLTPGKIEVGTVIQLRGAFRDQDGALTDPGTVVFRTRTPCGTETTYTFGSSDEIERASEGIYLATISITEAGRWYIRWKTTDPVVEIADEFSVQASPFSDQDGSADYA